MYLVAIHPGSAPPALRLLKEAKELIDKLLQDGPAIL